MLASVFQLAATAPRSIVRMPLASVGSAAALGISAGRNSGSCTVMGKIYGQPKRRRLDRAGRNAVAHAVSVVFKKQFLPVHLERNSPVSPWPPLCRRVRRAPVVALPLGRD